MRHLRSDQIRKLHELQTRFHIKNQQANKKLYEWFLGPGALEDGGREAVIVLWSYEQSYLEFVVACVYHESWLYMIRMWTMASGWELSVDMEMPVDILTVLKEGDLAKKQWNDFKDNGGKR